MLIAGLGHFVQGRTAGIGHSQNPGYLIEALPCRIVQGGTQNLHLRIVQHIYNHGMSAGDHQAQKRRLQIGIGQVVGRNVAPDVVHRDQGLVHGEGSGFREVHAHQHGANQPRGIGHGHGINVVPGQARVDERLVSQAVNGLDVLPGGNLRHHTAIEPVQVHLGGNAVRQHLPAVSDNGNGSLITGGLHRQNIHKLHSFRRISASSLGLR